MSFLLKRALDELSARVRVTRAGVRSLDHVCVVVPTAQSGRRLRQALAETYGAIVPPRVETPVSIRLDGNDPARASQAEEIAAFRDVTGSLRRGKTLSDIRAILAPKALMFRDVAEFLAVDYPEEAKRWRELETIEKAYLEILHMRGKKDSVEMMKDYSLPPEIEEVLRFDEFVADRKEEPCIPPFSQIVPCATPTDEAEAIADYFASVGPGEALPALCVADAELFPEIESAFKARGLKIHNPACTRLASSSLGHLTAQILSLTRTRAYDVFSAFIRAGDVRRYLARELKLTDDELTEALIDLDHRQTELLPQTIDDIASKTKGTLRAIFEFVLVQLRKKSPRQILSAIFKDVVINERDAGAREFVAAAECVSELMKTCGDDAELFELMLEETSYSLEPDEGDVILTDGWMELPFLQTKELVIAGFVDGAVPESVVGHAYLPDALRHRLGLADNASREVRDRMILSHAIASREPGAVRVYFHQTNARGDVCKPSRLLFETKDDADLIRRVTSFYRLRAGSEERSAFDVPNAWRLQLPRPPEYRALTKMSPTRLDGYVRCPFTYYLKQPEILGDKPFDDHAEELASWEFGNLAHNALEAFGLSEKRDSSDAREIADFLAETVDALLMERFGTAIPIIVAMQGESVKRRLADFAEVQAKRRQEGWRIRFVERKMEVTEFVGEKELHPVRFYGTCDRIDCNDVTGEWCVIDYKTWDTCDDAIIANNFQLPLYCIMLDADSSPELADAKRDRISAAYCVLGKTKENVGFSKSFRGDAIGDVEERLRHTIVLLERGIFWPPSKSAEWRYAFRDWLSPAPQVSVDEEWIADQERRVAAAKEEGLL